MPKTKESVLPLDRDRFLTLTESVFGTYTHIDAAMAHTLRLAGDMVETAGEIGLEPNVSQSLFDDLKNCIGTLLLSRQQFLKVHRRAHSIRQRTTVAWEGCPYTIDGEPATSAAPVQLKAVV
ncbi:hypothetical protein K3M67_20840 (plasmid) [Sphingobium sp. V4]|uniref:hypothetical protein n=1 Tax=Sphingobium sp. V4 TaxID=3038927 RepID=UPI002558381A|nr:hypothetical protein [Sphingobium sp. V4]WIW90463.1 hypothetical protein K3M67_20840 [Sphingobium sp. V4]